MQASRLPLIVAVVGFVAAPAYAQLPVPDFIPPPPAATEPDPPLQDREHILSVGIGTNAGFLGFRYARAVSGTLAIGMGFSRDVVVPHLELLTPGSTENFSLGLLDTYVTVGWMIGFGGDVRGSGSLTFEVGKRVPLQGGAYLEGGIGLVRELWGEPRLGMVGYVYPRLQFGIAF